MDISILNKQRILVILRHDKPFDVEGVFNAVLGTGLKTIEITLNTPKAFDLIEKAVKLFDTEVCIGAGTVLSLTELKKVVDIGGRFIVSPMFNREMVEYCSAAEIPVFPGALTPTEIFDAYKAGAYMVKVFPASVFGPSYLKTIKGPLSETKILAVGGINSANVNNYLSNGADAVAVGGGIIKQKWVESKNFQAIQDNIVKFRDAVECSIN